jgi:myo-inositol 2-dehydrogenase/D-chiro-inositol 1-dehydrogenase
MNGPNRHQIRVVSPDLSRRAFIGAAAAAGAALAAPAIARAAESSSDRVRLGFVGVGGRGSSLLGAVLPNRYAEVVAVCDLDAGRAKTAADRAEKAGGARPVEYLDHRKLLEDPKVQAVVSATPCSEHFRIYMDSMAAGKHLYGEKPMCVSVKEANEIVALQEKNPRLKVQIGFQRRSNPRFIEGVKLIREDKVLGDLIEGRCAFNNQWGPPEGLGGNGHWLSRVETSGDWMIEQAVHTWDVMNWVAGATPLRAFGLGHPGVFKVYNPDRNVHDFYTAILEFPAQLTVHFNHSWISPDSPEYCGAYDRYLGLLGAVDLGDGKITYSSRSKRKPEERTSSFQQDVTDDTRLSIDSFVDCIRNDRKPNSTVQNGRDATLVGLLVRKSVREKKVVTWEEMLATC